MSVSIGQQASSHPMDRIRKLHLQHLNHPWLSRVESSRVESGQDRTEPKRSSYSNPHRIPIQKALQGTQQHVTRKMSLSFDTLTISNWDKPNLSCPSLLRTVPRPPLPWAHTVGLSVSYQYADSSTSYSTTTATPPTPPPQSIQICLFLLLRFSPSTPSEYD